VTLNGLGDRAGNASLEQLAMLLRIRGIETGIDVSRLKHASRIAEQVSGVPVSKLAPVVGDSIFDHKSPSHLPIPAEFEAFDPEWVGSERRISAPDPVAAAPRQEDES
jgi:isopropylmalate/homocitrate/citramalate synthase